MFIYTPSNSDSIMLNLAEVYTNSLGDDQGYFKFSIHFIIS